MGVLDDPVAVEGEHGEHGVEADAQLPELGEAGAPDLDGNEAQDGVEDDEDS